MPRVNEFQRRKQSARNIIILHLAKEGYKLKEIAKIVKKRYNDRISVSRVHQIVKAQLEEEGKNE